MKDPLPSGALLLIILLFADGGRHMPVPAIGNAVKGVTAMRSAFPPASRIVPQAAPVQPQRRR